MRSHDDDQTKRAQVERMLYRQGGLSFLDRRDEWRRIFAEAWGTFLLVSVAAGKPTAAGGIAAQGTLGTTESNEADEEVGGHSS